MDSGRDLRVLIVLALLAPLSLVPSSFSSPSPPPVQPVEQADAVPSREALSEATEVLASMPLDAPTRLYRIEAGRSALESADASISVTFDSEVAPVAEFDATGVTVAALPEPVTAEPGSVPMMWITTAQSTLAALGGAMHTASETLHVRDVALTFAAARAPAQFALQPPSDWLVAAFWTVFLTALGALLAPRLAGLAGAVLYARLATSQMEDHPRRARVLESIRQVPGLHLAALQRETGIAGGVLRHHLEQLERHGLVRRVRAGRATHWFAATGLPVRAPPTRSQARLLQELKHNPDQSVQQLSHALGVSGQCVWKQLQRLGQARWVAPEREGRRVRWVPIA